MPAVHRHGPSSGQRKAVRDAECLCIQSLHSVPAVSPCILARVQLMSNIAGNVLIVQEPLGNYLCGGGNTYQWGGTSRMARQSIERDSRGDSVEDAPKLLTRRFARHNPPTQQRTLDLQECSVSQAPENENIRKKHVRFIFRLVCTYSFILVSLCYFSCLFSFSCCRRYRSRERRCAVSGSAGQNESKIAACSRCKASKRTLYEPDIYNSKS